jgi:lincosamide nucleotidyltransferase A/C/D/E
VVVLGGWGVDALIGEQTRAHKDLDLAVFLTDLPVIERRFSRFRRRGDDEYPGFVILEDELGRTLDLLLLEDQSGAEFRQRLRSGRVVTYPLVETTASGRIGGREVRCVSVAFQIRERERVDADEVDRGDLRLLQTRFPSTI